MIETDWNVVGRLLVLGIGMAMWGYVAFRRTPELDEVEKAGLYRWSLFALMLRGWCFIWFDLLNVFPL